MNIINSELFSDLMLSLKEKNDVFAKNNILKFSVDDQIVFVHQNGTYVIAEKAEEIKNTDSINVFYKKKLDKFSQFVSDHKEWINKNPNPAKIVNSLREIIKSNCTTEEKIEAIILSFHEINSLYQSFITR